MGNFTKRTHMGGPCFLLTPVGASDQSQVVQLPKNNQQIQVTGAPRPRFKRVTAPTCTDNFQLAPFTFAGSLWHSVEQCYQACKYIPSDPARFQTIQQMTPFAGERDSSHG